MGVVEEEADETQCWLDLVIERGLAGAEPAVQFGIPHSEFRIPSDVH
jgi:hypothetical protein